MQMSFSHLDVYSNMSQCARNYMTCCRLHATTPQQLKPCIITNVSDYQSVNLQNALEIVGYLFIA